MGEAALLVVGRFERVRLRLEDLEHLILREREARRLALRSEEGILDEGAAAAGSRGGGWLRSAIRRAQFATPAPPSSPGRVGAAVVNLASRADPPNHIPHDCATAVTARNGRHFAG